MDSVIVKAKEDGYVKTIMKFALYLQMEIKYQFKKHNKL